MYAASALAANTVARSACGAAAPLFTNQMFTAMGVGGGGSLIGGLAAVLAIIPFMFWKYGKAIRIRSKFAPTNVQKAAKPKDEEADPTEFALQQPLEEGGQASSSSSTVTGSNEASADVDEKAENKDEEKQPEEKDLGGESADSGSAQPHVYRDGEKQEA